jgi:hypothetical protein
MGRRSFPFVVGACLSGVLIGLLGAQVYPLASRDHQNPIGAPRLTWSIEARKVVREWRRLTVSSRLPTPRPLFGLAVDQSAAPLRIALEKMSLEDVRVSVVQGHLLEASAVSDRPDYLRVITLVRRAQQHGLRILVQVSDRRGRPLIEAGAARGRTLAWVAPSLLNEV